MSGWRRYKRKSVGWRNPFTGVRSTYVSYKRLD